MITRGWIVTDEGDRWSVRLDVRDLGEHLDTTFRKDMGDWILPHEGDRWTVKLDVWDLGGHL